MIVDFSEAQERVPLPEGAHDATIVDYRTQFSRTGDEYLVFTLSVQGALGDYWCGLKPAQTWKLAGFIHAAVGKRPPAQEVEIDPGKLVGRVVRVLVLKDDQNRPKIDRVYPVQGGESEAPY